MVGGSSAQDCVNAGLAKIFSNELAMKCSWYGKKGNIAVGNSSVINSLQGKLFIFLTNKQKGM